MLIFKEISNVGKEIAPEANKRRAPRYAVSPTFPLKTKLSLGNKNGRVAASTGNNGKVSTSSHGTTWKDWSGTLVDLSTTGANVHVSLAAVAFPEEAGRIKFMLGSYQLEIPCTVAHFRCYSRSAVCGLMFNFPDTETEKAYYQLLEPVMIGNSLTPVEAKPDASGRHREQYVGKNSALLTVWRQAPGGEMASFDFRMNSYGVRLNAGLTELITYGIEEEGPNTAKASARPVLKLKLKVPEKKEDIIPTIPLTEAQDEEVRWLFCLAVSNLSTAVAADVRKLLLSLVVA